MCILGWSACGEESCIVSIVSSVSGNTEDSRDGAEDKTFESELVSWSELFPSPTLLSSWSESHPMSVLSDERADMNTSSEDRAETMGSTSESATLLQFI